MSRTRLLLTGLIVLTLLGLGVLTSMMIYQDEPSQRPDAQWETSSNGERETPRVLTPGAPLAHDESHLPIKENESGDPPGSNSDEVIVVIGVVTEDGEPVIGASLEWRSPQGPVSARAPTPFTTDSAGECRIELRAPSWFVVRSADERWALDERAEAHAGLNEVRFIARPLGGIEILALCEDGSSFAGECRVSSGTIDPAHRLQFKLASGGYFNFFNIALKFDGSNPARLTRVPLTQDLEFSFGAWVIGYGEQRHYVERSRLFDGARILIMLTSSPTAQGGLLEFDWTGYEAEVLVTEITQPGGKLVLGGGRDYDGPPYRSHLLRPGEYVLRIKGKPGWESPSFRIEPRSVTRLEYADLPQAEVSVLVVDENGDPIGKALLTRNHATYPNLDRPFRAQPGAALTEVSGKATLKNVPSGSQTFLIEAQGYEPVLVAQDLAPEQTNDLGTVTLRPCTGKITVRLVGMREKQTYSVMLLQPGGSGVRVVKDLTVDEVVLETLPARKYVVAVVAGRGGQVATQAVEITREASVHDVVLDVSALVEGTMKPD